MRTINADNVNEALYLGLRLLNSHGIKRNSRNGEVVMLDSPVCTIYKNSRQRVCLWPERNANPFFHLFESLWMISGRNDVEYVTRFAKNMRNFSDDGITFHGAYGHRWRKFFSRDQLGIIIERLKKNPDDRRCVLQMWDSDSDLGASVKDVPCNTHIYFSIDVNGFLDMTVCNRSNDIIWGAYGANAVHMSVLQEYIAYGIGAPIGKYYQISNNWHAYTDILKKSNLFSLLDQEYIEFYSSDSLDPVEETLIFDTEKLSDWEAQNEMFLDIDQNIPIGFTSLFFKKTAVPMLQAWKEWKRTDISESERVEKAVAFLDSMPKHSDWKKACKEWLLRKVVK